MNRRTLLEMLHLTCPLTFGFREELPACLQLETLKPKTNLLSIGNSASRIYYLVSGYAKANNFDLQGRENVVRLYHPREIITDVQSFFQPTTSKISISTISACEVLVLAKKDYVKFHKYQETAKLNEGLLLREKKMDSYRNLLLRLSSADKVKEFFKYNHGHHLPNKDCASYLQMSTQTYCREKGKYNRKK